MKFRKGIQGIVEVITTGALILILTTIESDWTLDYLAFVGINMMVLLTGGWLLHKYGR